MTLNCPYHPHAHVSVCKECVKETVDASHEKVWEGVIAVVEEHATLVDHPKQEAMFKSLLGALRRQYQREQGR